MKQVFTPKSFSRAHSAVIDSANEVIRQYQAQGYDLTLRQLYYQFVALNLFPDEWLVSLPGGQLTKNHERNYKKLGGILNDARLAGEVDWGAIVDRTRELTEWQHQTSVADALRNLHQYYTLDRWTNQACRVEVWVEKEALVGVIERSCMKFDVPYFACRGYTSASSSYAAYERIRDRMDNGQRTVVLHFGDHDPSGIDMTRDNRDRMQLMIETEVGDDFYDAFEFRRLALNYDQVKKFNPPPSPAKITDSRAKGYIEAFGDDSWELDALPPDKLAALVENEIQSLIDDEEWESRSEEIEDHRSTLQRFIEEAAQ